MLLWFIICRVLSFDAAVRDPFLYIKKFAPRKAYKYVFGLTGDFEVAYKCNAAWSELLSRYSSMEIKRRKERYLRSAAAIRYYGLWFIIFRFLECGFEVEQKGYALEIGMEFIRTGLSLDQKRIKDCIKLANALDVNPNAWDHFEGNLMDILGHVGKTVGRKRKREAIQSALSKKIDCKGICCTSKRQTPIKILNV